MPMSDESREKLREIRARERKQNPLPKDYEVVDYLMSVDYLKEKDPEFTKLDDGNISRILRKKYVKDYEDLTYLKYFSQDVVEALARVLPCRKITLLVPQKKTTREVYVFYWDTLYRVLEILNLNISKYTNYPNHIARNTTTKESL